MHEKKLLIAGIDPGTTLAYAILDLDGNIVDIGSSKGLDIGQLIMIATNHGKVIKVATDKSKTPSFVEKFASKLGSQVIKPFDDTKVSEKIMITSGHNVENHHQRDALASALYAYNSLRPLLNKIDSFLEDRKKPYLKNQVREIVLAYSINISDALSILEKPKKEEEHIVKKIMEEKKLGESDYLILYGKLKRAEKSIALLQKQNQGLENKVKDIDSISRLIAKQLPKESTNEQLLENLNFKEKSIMQLSHKLKEKDAEIGMLKDRLKALSYFLSSMNDYVLVKRLRALGGNSDREDKAINIQPGDVLLVEDPNIISENTIRSLKEKVAIIIHEKPVSSKIKENLPFVFIPASLFRIHKHGSFAFIPKDLFIREKNKAGILQKIVEDYKKERASSL